MSFKTFSKKQFEYLLNQELYKKRLGFMKEVQDFNTSYGWETWEYVYEISTKNPAVKIIIFSSIDKRTDRTREYGDDRVRLVMRWDTKSGPVYKRIKRHNRMDNLFTHLAATLKQAQDSVFKLNYKDFNSPTKQPKGAVN